MLFSLLALLAATVHSLEPTPPRSRVVCRTPGDTSQNCYRLYETKEAARAMTVLLPGYGGGVDDFRDSTLPARLASEGVAIAVVSPTPRGTGYLDEAGLDALNEIVADAAR